MVGVALPKVSYGTLEVFLHLKTDIGAMQHQKMKV
jgi:hypothetical protein